MLVLAGAPGDDAAAVRAAIDALPPGRRDDVHVTGPVSAATKSWLVRAAAVLAYPSLDEGFGFPLLEAQGAGTPVVATRAGSIPEVAGDGAELVPVGDVDALAVALFRVLGDDDRRARPRRRRYGQPRRASRGPPPPTSSSSSTAASPATG